MFNWATNPILLHTAAAGFLQTLVTIP